MFAELLPLDETRRREAVVWLAFTTAARTDARLEPYVVRFAEGMRALAGRVVARAVEDGLLRR